MSSVTINRIEYRLRDHEPARYDLRSTTRQAAVAMILRESGPGTEALFIRRSANRGDPWSGQMAFPGGHLDPVDDTLKDAAERETLEEIGLDLRKHGRFLGQIDQVRANPRGRDIDLVVTPFVYALETGRVELVPNYEVAEILWGSLEDMYTGEASTTDEFYILEEKHTFPGYGIDGHLVWGLTYRMLDHLFNLVDRSRRN